MNYFSQFWRVLLLLCLAQPLLGQTSARIWFDKPVVETGDPFVLTVEVPDLPQDIDFSTWEPLLPDSSCVRVNAWEPDYEKHIWYQTRVYVVFDSADLRLPPVTVLYKSGDSEATNGLDILIVPTPAPTDINDMAGIKDIHREPFSLWALLWSFRLFILAALIGILLFVLLIYLIARSRRIKTQPPPIPLSARERALQQLDALAQRQLWQQNRIKDYYDALTHIARGYVQEEYGIRALELTTEESLLAARTAGLSDATTRQLEQLLNWGDLAKFARQTPPADFHDAALSNVMELIEG